MLLSLRALLWQSGPISGTASTVQASQTNDDVGFTPVAAQIGGSLPARRRRGAGAIPIFRSEAEIYPQISGACRAAQRSASTLAEGRISIGGDGAQLQSAQASRAFGEMIDTDLDLLFEILMEVA